MNRFLALATLAVLALVGAAKEKITFVPGHCVVADQFMKPCRAAKYGGFECQKVHISIKPLPDCQQYDHERFIQVPH